MRLVTALSALALLAAAPASAQAVFVNEINYDPPGTDAGEFVEVAGPAGTGLSDWAIILYNQAGAAYDTEPLSGTIPDQQGGFGTLAFPIDGIQNGPNDGLALVDPAGAVVQFLSYEGPLTAANGPASGMTSEDIGVSQTNDEGTVQLTGTGSTYSDFTWSGPAASPGAVNAGQTFMAGTSTTPVVSFATASASADEGETVTLTVSLDFPNDTPDNNPVEVTVSLDGASTASSADFSGATLPATLTFDGTEDEQTRTLTFDLASGDGAEGPETLVFALAVTSGTATVGAPSTYTLTINDTDEAPGVAEGLVINEVDPDQEGTDAAEFVELYNGGAEPVDLSDYVLVLFNGSDDQSYDAFDLEGTLAPGAYFVFCGDAANVANCDLDVEAGTTNLIQNGPDAVALYVGAATGFPNDTPMTTDELVDAVVYGSGAADEGLLAGLGQTTQYDEGENGAGTTESLQRSPDGAARFGAGAPTPGAANADLSTAAEGDLDAALALTVANPIRSAATVRFSLATAGEASLVLYDALGRRVLILAEGPQAAGPQAVALDAAGLAPGVYVLRLQTETAAASRTLTVVR